MSIGLQVIYGGGSLWGTPALTAPETIQTLLDLLEAHGVRTIDTAKFYVNSEKALGQARAPARFTIDTKAPGGYGDRPATRANVVQDANESRDLLDGATVDVYYLHAPDAATPLEDTLAGINDVYQSGFFQRFGLSNFSAEDVQKAYDICKANGYPLPTVYQGRYGPVDRQYEQTLFPTLRKLDMAFYAYSPMAGGLLAKSKDEVLAGKGRFDTSTFLGKAFSALYAKPQYLDLLDRWAKIAETEGTTRSELAYRWVRYHSSLAVERGDAVIIGTSSLQQTEETLPAVGKGPLSDAAVDAIEEFSKAIAAAVGQQLVAIGLESGSG